MPLETTWRIRVGEYGNTLPLPLGRKRKHRTVTMNIFYLSLMVFSVHTFLKDIDKSNLILSWKRNDLQFTICDFMSRNDLQLLIIFSLFQQLINKFSIQHPI